MANAFFRLRKAEDKRPQIIYVGYRFGSDQLIHSTGVKVLPKHWDFKKSRVKNILDFYPKDEVNSFLVGLENFVNAQANNFKAKKQDLTKEALKYEINNFLNPNKDLKDKPKTLFDFIKKFITDSKSGRRSIENKNVNERTVKRYSTTETLLKEFEKSYSRTIDFQSIDLDFYKDFNSFMMKTKNYAPATMGKHISTLKTFLKEATEEGINKNLKFQSKAFKVVESESDSIALSDTDLLELYKLDLTGNDRLEKVRDLFLIGSNTGLRFSDFTDIQPDNIKQDSNGYTLNIIQFKTKNKVVIPLNTVALEILHKYDFKLPKAISNQKFNDYIKEVAYMVERLHEKHEKVITKGGITEKVAIPRYELISSHTARRSYCTNAYERGTPAISLMQISGHLTEQSFLKYIKTSKEKHAEIVRKHQ
jgi:site-specific recombinase XerD